MGFFTVRNRIALFATALIFTFTAISPLTCKAEEIGDTQEIETVIEEISEVPVETMETAKPQEEMKPTEAETKETETADEAKTKVTTKTIEETQTAETTEALETMSGGDIPNGETLQTYTITADNEELVKIGNDIIVFLQFFAGCVIFFIVVVLCKYSYKFFNIFF